MFIFLYNSVRKGKMSAVKININVAAKAAESYFGLSEAAAQYICYRAVRSILPAKHPKYLPFDIKLQNAIIELDKCIGVMWNRMFFTRERDYLILYGIILEDMPVTVVRRCEINLAEDDWTVVEDRKKIRRKRDKGLEMMRAIGLILQ